jgi:membrane protein implicated in regulation of membrane protease activity
MLPAEKRGARMNRMGPLVLVLATANALAAAAMAGAVAAVVIFLGIIAAGFLWFRSRPAEEEEPAQPEGPAGRRAMAIGRQGAHLLVRLDGRDWPARTADGTAALGYGDPVRVVAVDGMVLIVRPDTGA